MTIDLYKVCIAKVSFLESSGYKVRPVIVVSESHGEFDVVMAIPISTKTELTSVDVKLRDWQESGLKQPSVAFVHRMAAMVAVDVLEEIGQLSKADQVAIQNALRKLFNL